VLYAINCNGFQDGAAISGAINPDLRHSGAIPSEEAIREITVHGAL